MYRVIASVPIALHTVLNSDQEGTNGNGGLITRKYIEKTERLSHRQRENQ
jgi:hypothetical protein